MAGMPAQSRRYHKAAQSNTNCVAPYVIAAIGLVVTGAGCASQLPRSAGTFIEEFEGFPIYHGEPERPYEVLRPVYSEAAAAQGVSPMKRASVAEARRLRADAIIVGVAFDDAGSAESQEPDTIEASRASGKWELAVAIRWR